MILRTRVGSTGRSFRLEESSERTRGAGTLEMMQWRGGQIQSNWSACVRSISPGRKLSAGAPGTKKLPIVLPANSRQHLGRLTRVRSRERIYSSGTGTTSSGLDMRFLIRSDKATIVAFEPTAERFLLEPNVNITVEWFGSGDDGMVAIEGEYLVVHAPRFSYTRAWDAEGNEIYIGPQSDPAN